MKHNWFITGTDTNVGKTIFSNILLKIGKNKGYKTIGYKPISSYASNNTINHTDIEILKKNSMVSFPNEIINPFNFNESAPPHFISKRIKKHIDPNIISKNLDILRKKSNWIVIEGAGGWHTPISDTILYSDWVYEKKIPVILVIGIKLGCINHAILTSEAIINKKLILFGWISNNINTITRYNKEYLFYLKKNIKAPFLGHIPFLNKKNSFQYNEVLSIFDKSIFYQIQ
ncbi:ATP-dependent dethiobiotin synthetase BioD [Buchnera aphidicola (Thelaxes suberi)]|uniref:dethiobiotin synthase n=1 Tax=Buchnera aphidicola TaxID=9 RepID=UPI0034644BF7